jgi:Required for nuclear transport of RNA pol II C-terminus 1
MNWDETESLLPLLQYFSESHEDAAIKQIALSLKVAVATHCTVQMEFDSVSELGNTATANKAMIASSTAGRNKLIEVIGDVTTSSTLTELKNHVSDGNSTFQEALQMMKDPLVPVQGHAMILLRRLVERGNKDALESNELLFSIGVDNIAHSDSYIYLTAVQLLSALITKCHKNLLPRLVKEYLSDVTCNTQLPADSRMKLGEVLVKVSAALGKHLFLFNSAIRIKMY